MASAPLFTLSLVALAMCASPPDAGGPDAPTRTEPSRAASATPAAARPTRFRFTIGGGPGMLYPAGHQIAELRGDTLVHLGLADPFPTGPRPETSVVPTAAAWRAFRATLDSLDAFAWQPVYENPGVDDGTQWRLEIVYPDRRVRAEGDNGYPGPVRVRRDGDGDGDGDRPDDVYAGSGYSEAFEAFLRAVNRLSGHPAFTIW